MHGERGRTNEDEPAGLARRAVDILLSATLLVAVLPLLLVVVLVSAVSLRAWPFFTQDRVGQGGELFRFLKVRTLRPEVPGYVDKHQLDVDRIPAACRLMRRLHLDELPQLLLVLRGRMSLVGPRPELACLHDQLPPAFAELRTSVSPGCTGLWQISESCTDLIGAAPEYDRFYLEHRSWRLDLYVLVRTALQMLNIGRCVTLEDVPQWAAPRAVPAPAAPATSGAESITVPATAGR